jgi:hypothetical protein
VPNTIAHGNAGWHRVKRQRGGTGGGKEGLGGTSSVFFEALKILRAVAQTISSGRGCGSATKTTHTVFCSLLV